MTRAAMVGPLEAGQRALRSGNWAAALEAFTAAAADGGSAEALDGLGRARWWLKDVAGALEARTRAYAGLRRTGRYAEAAAVAVWLAREHRALYRNAVVADGWLARARRAANRAGAGSTRGWIALAEAEAADDVDGALARLQQALEAARRHDDADLEIVALARQGATLVAGGQVAAGLACLDEAMTAATAGEGADPRSVAEACCALLEAAGLLGDPGRVATWAEAVDRFRAAFDFGPLAAYPASVSSSDVLAAFCGACCGGIHLVTGRLDDAETALQEAIADLGAGQLHSRCLHPVVQLAELRILQGRLEEAERLLAGFEDLPESVRPLAILDLARGAPKRAVARLETRIAALEGQAVAALPLWLLLVDALLTVGDTAAAGGAAEQAARGAALTGSARHEAAAAFAAAKVAAARREPHAPAGLRAAATRLAAAGLALEACRARLAYARALVDSDRGTAVAEARSALTTFDRLGAGSDADDAAALLRELGVRGRTGPKHVGVLSRREQEVLRLVAAGLSNAEIAERLHISVKTAGHHVSHILAKLGLRSRTEAAAYAVLNVPKKKPARA